MAVCGVIYGQVLTITNVGERIFARSFYSISVSVDGF